MRWTRDRQNLIFLGLVLAICSLWLRSGSARSSATVSPQPSPSHDLQRWPPERPSAPQDSYRLPVEGELHVVGVYEGYYPGGGSPHRGGYHPEGAVDVVVDRPGKTLNLVLTCYEPAEWRVSVKKGRVARVLLSGCHRQRISGLPEGTPVVASSHEEPGAFLWFFWYPGSQQYSDGQEQRMRAHFAQPVDSEQGAYKAEAGKPYLVQTSVPH